MALPALMMLRAWLVRDRQALSVYPLSFRICPATSAFDRETVAKLLKERHKALFTDRPEVSIQLLVIHTPYLFG